MKLWFVITETGYITIKAPTKGKAMSEALKMGIKSISIKCDNSL